MLLRYRLPMVVLTALLLLGCSPEPPIDNGVDLDGTQIFDPLLDHPERFLLSHRFIAPTPQQLDTPVVVAVHGFSGTPWEWNEFADYALSKKTFFCSQVLLGGHGMTYEVFRRSSWEDWQSSIIREYKSLDFLGYTHISLAGSSTGATLILELLSSGKLNAFRPPEHIFMIDPIVLPSNKFLSLVNFVGPLMGYTETPLDSAQNGHYYKYRPQEALSELLELLELTRHNLEDGITLPNNMDLYIYKSIRDPSADPVSALLLYKGISTSFGKPSVKMVDSDLHVFTCLKGRNSYSQKDRALQLTTFGEIESVVAIK